MYRVIPNFITTKEQQYLKEYTNKKVLEANGKLKSYSDHEQLYSKTNIANIEPLYYFYIQDDLKTNTLLAEIVRKMQVAVGVSEENPNTYFNWVISIAPPKAEVLAHVDPISPEVLKDKKIVRINLLVQNAARGGRFELTEDKQGKGSWVEAKIPDMALMTFDASDIWHQITKNMSNTTRINLSIDAVVDR
jgi:hypothetical protein